MFSLHAHIVLLVLKQKLTKLFLIDLDHISFFISFAIHHLLDLFAIYFFLILFVLHILFVHYLLVFIILLFDVLLHAFNSIILDIALYFFVFTFAFSIFLIIILFINAYLHHLLLLLEGLYHCGLLFWRHVIEVLDVFLCNHSRLHLLGIRHIDHLLVVCHLLLLERLELFFIDFIHFFPFFFIFPFTFTLTAFIIFFSILHLLLTIPHFVFFLYALHVCPSLHQRLAVVLRWEVSCSQVETIIVVSGHEEFSLLVSKVLIWIVASFSEESHISLEFLDLVEVVDESLGYLFDKKRSICHFEFDVSFQGFVRLLNNGHVLLGNGF